MDENGDRIVGIEQRDSANEYVARRSQAELYSPLVVNAEGNPKRPVMLVYFAERVRINDIWRPEKGRDFRWPHTKPNVIHSDVGPEMK